MPTPTNQFIPTPAGTNATGGSTTPAPALQPTAPTSPAYNQTPSAPAGPGADLSQFVDSGYESNLAENSGMGTDLTSPSTPSFIQEEPADAPQATEWDVTPEQLTQTHFTNIMEKDSPAFDVIREQIKRGHAASGGQNSLMAERSATMAVADVAFQMASQDAATFARSAEFNAAMKNQFGLASQAFMHNALLNEQNFRQGVMMLREQHAATLEQIEADLAARVAQMGAQQAIDLKMEATKQQNILAQMDRAHRNTLEQMENQFQYTWQTNEQAHEQQLERMDRETMNASFLDEQKTRWQTQLNYMSEVGQNSRQLMATVGAIGSNPNITPAQASAAIADAVRQYNAVNDQLAAVYTLPTGTSAATQYLNFAGHNTGYGTNTAQGSPRTPFYGGGTPTPASAPAAPRPVAAPIPAAPSFVPVAPAPAKAPVAAPIAAPATRASSSIAFDDWFTESDPQGRPVADPAIYNANPAYKQAWDTVWAFHNGNLHKTSDKNALAQHLASEYDKAVAAGVPTSRAPAPAPAPAPAAPYTAARPAGGSTSGPKASTARTSMK